MRKRANGEGTISKRVDGRWEAKMILDGARRKSFYGKTRQEVNRKLATALKAQQDGLPIPSDQLTVGAYLTHWLETVRPSLRPRTLKRYSEYVRLHIILRVGKLPLSRLGPQHLQQLYANRLEAGLSPTSVAHLHAVLHRALGRAARWGLVARNVADVVTPPRIQRQEMTTLSPEQARQFLEAVAGERLEALYVLAITTGMRQGELLGLRWRDVDLDRQTLKVIATLQRTPDGFTFSEPKTARSRRQVELTASAAAALRRHRAAQNQERLKLGTAWEDNDLVFANEVGRPIEATNLIRHSFHPLLKRAGLTRMPFHSLRHTAATLLLGQGTHPKLVADMLGHSQIAVTLDLYSHTTPAMHRQAALALDALLGTPK